MHDQDRLYDLLRQSADLRVRSARARAKADRCLAKSRQLVTWTSKIRQETGHARPVWQNPGLISPARRR